MTKQIQHGDSGSADVPQAPRLSPTIFVAIACAVIALVGGSHPVLAQGVTAPASVKEALHDVGLGNILTSANGGEIFGFDINENADGTDGILTEAVTEQNGSVTSAVETFDLTSGQITKTVKTLVAPKGGDQLETFGIFGNDIGLVDYEREFDKNGQLRRDDLFGVLNPVSGGKFTGPWTPPHPKDSVLQTIAQNQSTSTQVAMVFRLTENLTEP